jgi:hypothetical protein
MFKEKIKTIIIRFKNRIYRAIKYCKLYILFSILGCFFLLAAVLVLYTTFKDSPAIMNNFPGIVLTLVSSIVISLFFLSLKEVIVLSKEKEESKEQVTSFFKLRHHESDQSIVEIVDNKYKSFFQ